MITRTVGVGGDFADFRAARVALEAVTPLGNDYEFDQISDVAEAAVWPTNLLDLNAHTVTFTCSYNQARLNNFLSWYTISMSPNIEMNMVQNVLGNTSNTVWEYLFPFRNSVNLGAHATIIGVGCSGRGNTSTVRDCYIKGIVGVVFGDYGLTMTRERDGLKMSNCKIWGCWRGLNLQQGVSSPGNYTNKYIENTDFYANRTGVYLPNIGYDNYGRFKNVVSCGSTYRDWDGLGGGVASIYAENCADSDGTLIPVVGSNNLFNIVPVDEFKSLDDTNADFLKLNDGEFNVGGISVSERGEAPLKVQFADQTEYSWPDGVLADGGTAPTLTDEDIEGLSIPNAEGFYSIGCHQAQIV